MIEDENQSTSPNIWDGAYKIPWHDPDFSRRMLAEHLSQTHDMASRRVVWIDRQVDWIHRNLLASRPAGILDLGCGPGFYSHRLAACGHRCRGLDFSPASIEYARQHNPAASRCEFILGDLRDAAFGGPYDLAMILFGEMNVFSPDEVLEILQNARASLIPPGGKLILEIQTPEAVERSGRAAATEERHNSGLFSDRPYVCRTECRWLAGEQVAIQTFTVTDAGTGMTQTYRNTTKAWAPGDLQSLLHTAGFCSARSQSDWPCNTDDLALWSAVAG